MGAVLSRQCCLQMAVRRAFSRPNAARLVAAETVATSRQFFPMPIFNPERTARALLAVLLLGAFAGCRRTEAEYQKLVQENAYLRSEIERLNRRGVEEKTEEKGGGAVGPPDLALTVLDLWSQRFEDVYEYRSRSRLSGKSLRVTGGAEVLSGGDSISMTGESKRFGPVQMGAHLSPGYAQRIQAGLAALERGTVVTVQGKFNYERMILVDAMFVDQTGGRILYSDDLLSLSAGVPLGGAMRSAPATPAPKAPATPAKATPPPAPPATRGSK